MKIAGRTLGNARMKYFTTVKRGKGTAGGLCLYNNSHPSKMKNKMHLFTKARNSSCQKHKTKMLRIKLMGRKYFVK